MIDVTLSRKSFLSVSPKSVQLLLFSVLLWGSFIRLYKIDMPGLWLDEIIGIEQSQSIPVFWKFRIGAIDPEQGPIFHSILRLCGGMQGSETAIRIPFAIAGILSIVVMCFLGSTIVSKEFGLLAAMVLASSPIHIYYSREARPYSFLILLVLIGLLSLFKIMKNSNALKKWFWILAGVNCLFLLISAHGIFYSGALMALLPLSWFAAKGKISSAFVFRWLNSCLLVIALFFLMYFSVESRKPQIQAPTFSIKMLTLHFQELLFGDHTYVGISTFMILSGFIILGYVRFFLFRPIVGAKLLLFFLIGFFLPLAALLYADHWVSSRYLLLALPGLLVAEAFAFYELPILFSHSLHIVPGARLKIFIVAVVLLSIGVFHFPFVDQTLKSKADWKEVASFVQKRSRPGDLILTSNAWGKRCLGFHLERIGARLQIESAEESLQQAKKILRQNDVALLVTGGFHYGYSVPAWMKQFPTLFTAKPEQIGIHYYPHHRIDLSDRLLTSDIELMERTFWETSRGDMIGPAAKMYLLTGWSSLQFNERRSTRYLSRRAVLFIPVNHKNPSKLQIEIAASGPSSVGQSVFVGLNQKDIGKLNLTSDWKAYWIDLSNTPLRKGINFLLLEQSLCRIEPCEAKASDSQRRWAKVRSLIFI